MPKKRPTRKKISLSSKNKQKSNDSSWIKAEFKLVHKGLEKLDRSVNMIAEQVSKNTSAIISCESAIAKNTSSITENVSAIAENRSAIAENASAIAGNRSAIAANASAIAENRSAIAENASAINRNALAIAKNAEGIEAIRGSTIVLENGMKEVLTILREGQGPQLSLHQTRLDDHERRLSKIEESR